MGDDAWQNWSPHPEDARAAPFVRWSVRVEVVVTDETKREVRAKIASNLVDHFGMDEGTGMISVPLIGVVFGVVTRTVGEAAQTAADTVLTAAALPSDALYGVTIVSDAVPDEPLPRDYPHLLD